MRPLQTLIGLIIVIIGVTYLGINFGWWSASAWNNVVQLWPLLLVILGLRLLLRGAMALLFVLVGLILLFIAGIATGVVKTDSYTTSSSYHFKFRRETEIASFYKEIDLGNATGLKVNLGGNYKIGLQPMESKTVSVNFTGPKSAMDALSFDREGSQLVLREKSYAGRFWQGAFEDVKGTITLPNTLPLAFDLSGLTDVVGRGSNAKLTLHASGSSHVEFDDSQMIDPIIDMSGTGTVTLGNCSGTAKIDMSGAGKFTAQKCDLTHLTINASGTAVIDIKSGAIQDVDITGSGVTSIHMPKPTGKINQNNTGASTITYY